MGLGSALDGRGWARSGPRGSPGTRRCHPRRSPRRACRGGRRRRASPRRSSARAGSAAPAPPAESWRTPPPLGVKSVFIPPLPTRRLAWTVGLAAPGSPRSTGHPLPPLQAREGGSRRQHIPRPGSGPGGAGCERDVHGRGGAGLPLPGQHLRTSTPHPVRSGAGPETYLAWQPSAQWAPRGSVILPVLLRGILGGRGQQ